MEGRPKFEMDRLIEYSHDAVLEEMRRVAAVVSAARLTKSAFDAVSRVSASTAQRRFGSWQAALDAAGLGHRYAGTVVSQKMRNQTARGLSNEDIIAELRRVAVLVGRAAITNKDIRAHSTVISPRVVCSRFGSWEKGLEAAGLSLSRRGHRYSEDEFFENLLTVWTHHGRMPTFSEMDEPPSTISAGGYFKRFGTWGRAKSAFVERMNSDLTEGAPNTSSLGVPAEDNAAGRPRRSPRAPEDQRSIRLGLRYDVLRRDRFRCVVCGNSPATDPTCRLHVDHVLAVANGGKTVAENLRTTCEPCNLGKGAKLA